LTRFVVDASVALAWIFDDESNEYAESILRSLKIRSCVVPAHWALEVTNSLLFAERKGRITTADSTRGLVLLDGLPISMDGLTAEKARTQTLALARTHRLTVYDAAYLELSLREGLALATLDSDLLAASQQVGCKIA